VIPRKLQNICPEYAFTLRALMFFSFFVYFYIFNNFKASDKPRVASNDDGDLAKLVLILGQSQIVQQRQRWMNNSPHSLPNEVLELFDQKIGS